MDKPVNPPSASPVRALPSYAWWMVLCLVGLDYFSTLAYLPSIAVNDAGGAMAPLAAFAVVVVTLLAALPVYLYVVGRSPHGQGATGLLESHIRGWGGKILILVLLGFVATDFIITRTLSVADASKHLIHNPYFQSQGGWMTQSKESLRRSLPPRLRGPAADRLFDWWDEQLVVTVILSIITFGLYFYLLRGFTRGFLYMATFIVALFLLLNTVVIASGLVYLANHPNIITNWMDIVRYGMPGQDATDLTITLTLVALQYFPQLALGLSGFELSMTSAPLVRGRPEDDPVRPRGRIRNTRKLLIAAALIMSPFVASSVLIVTVLVPPGALGENGPARHRALAYLAHGGALQPPGARVSTDNPVGIPPEGPDDGEDVVVPPEKPAGQPNAADQQKEPGRTGPRATDLNPLFGPVFGTLYDLSTILILCLAGASVTISLRSLVPQYLMRYGMQMHWAHRIGVILHLFNLVILIVVIFFRASVSHQEGAYATSVLVLLMSATLAAIVDLRARWRGSILLPFVTAPLVLIGGFFLLMAYQVARHSPAGVAIALLFVGVILVTGFVSRWLRSSELRFEGFTFVDEYSKTRWEEIRNLEFQVLVPHRPNHQTLTEKDNEIRTRHRLGPDVPIIFIQAELGDPSNFHHEPLMRIAKDNGMEVIRVSHCTSIAHVLAAIALDFREVGRPPEMHFAWSEESPLAATLHFLLWGEGNIPLLVHALIHKFEPNPERRPRVVIG